MGYKNLLKMQFQIVSILQELKVSSFNNIPLIFIEEPESHMHPQMQTSFSKFLTEFISNYIKKSPQVLMTTHSSHISNTIDFESIRYSKRYKNNVIYKNIANFKPTSEEARKFIKKYLTLNKCDLYFADKVILVEGASERILLPDMISKIEGNKTKTTNNLSNQYYSIIEIGGAYAHIFIPLIEFLEIPCLIITDIDAIRDDKKCLTEEGTHSSNATINNWVKYLRGKQDDSSNSDGEEVTLENIFSLTKEQKTRNLIHIEFQVKENGLCGRSLEEAIINANRKLFNIPENSNSEADLANTKKKTDFALDLLFGDKQYNVPLYIKEGIEWLAEKNIINGE